MAAFSHAISRAFPLSRNRGNRGDYTFDPQIPPSASRDGLQQLEPKFLRMRLPTWLVSNRIATLGRTAESFSRVKSQSCVRPRAGDGTSMFVTVRRDWRTEVFVDRKYSHRGYRDSEK